MFSTFKSNCRRWINTRVAAAQQCGLNSIKALVSKTNPSLQTEQASVGPLVLNDGRFWMHKKRKKKKAAAAFILDVFRELCAARADPRAAEDTEEPAVLVSCPRTTDLFWLTEILLLSDVYLFQYFRDDVGSPQKTQDSCKIPIRIRSHYNV